MSVIAIVHTHATEQRGEYVITMENAFWSATYRYGAWPSDTGSNHAVVVQCPTQGDALYQARETYFAEGVRNPHQHIRLLHRQHLLLEERKP